MSNTEPQVLNSIDNIKIPYPIEGVIRTAQLDDTVAPANSVQLAVNMNFDRIGAMQTRPGVTQYADDLVAAINNYGTLHNELLPNGYNFLAQLGESNDLTTTTFHGPSAVKIDDATIVVFWADGSNHGFCQKFSVNETTGVVLPIASPVEFDSSSGLNNKAILVNSILVLNTWTGASSHGKAQCFLIAADTIIPEGSPLTFDATNGANMALAQIDATHFLCCYTSSSADGVVTVFEVNTGTGGVTQPGSPTTFESGSNFNNSCVAVGDGTHFINFWTSNTGGEAQCFSVNTGTWAIAAVGSPLTFDTGTNRNNASAVGDGSHFVNIFQNSTGRLAARCFTLNLSTFAVTATAAAFSGTSVGNDLTAIGFGDGYHFVAFYSKNVGDGYVQMMVMDPVAFTFSLINAPLSGYDFANGGYTTSLDLTTYKVMVVWGNVGAVKGQAAIFEAFGNVVEGRWLYAGYSTKVANVPAGSTTWTDRRTGLATVGKPRFSQFLNYIWMVNGNGQIGGDPVATSNGGAFGTDLVPANFPKGDFIHGGFEGRVWVADKALGIIYYTDIVQFSPPNVYTLTYNPQVDFITTIAPQTGETFSGLFEVPRALLVFTQNTITRIYGASSIDAYPAYNVGTYSQESIVQTKTGIFFHHSSGFYQFAYGGQPVEISRRIIDFIQAIPRTNYENIVGVYDGFDNVEWAIGQVVVEGILFTDCVARYTISTQVWTIYDYPGHLIKSMIFYDDGTALNHLMGTSLGKTGSLDTGTTDFGEGFYYEVIDRWRAFTDMYYIEKRIDSANVYHKNAAGANLMYQADRAGPNAWKQLGAITADNVSVLPNSNSDDFNVLRLRIAGNTKGTAVIIHGIELLQITIKGQKRN